MTRLQPELGATVVDKVVFGIKPAMDQLRVLVCLGPVLRHAGLGQRQKGRQEGRADRLGKGEIGLPVAAIQVIVKDATDAPRPAGFDDIETLPQRYDVMPADVDQMKAYIADHTGL